MRDAEEDQLLQEEAQRVRAEKKKKALRADAKAIVLMFGLPVPLLLGLGATWGCLSAAMATCTIISIAVVSVGNVVVIGATHNWSN